MTHGARMRWAVWPSRTVRVWAVCLVCLALVATVDSTRASAATGTNPRLVQEPWDAAWIEAPGTSPVEYGVYHFRRSFVLPERPASFVVHVSADNRYELFANGTRVALGPARARARHWRFETLDIAAHLQAGRNVLAAVVWNHGRHSAMAQETWRTGFLMQGNSDLEAVINSGPAWKAMQNQAYEPLVYASRQLRGYFVVGPGDRVDGRRFPWGWEQVEFDDRDWAAASIVRGRHGPLHGRPRTSDHTGEPWPLVPRDIPMLEDAPQRIARTRAASGVDVPRGFPLRREPLHVAPRTKARLLLDQTHLTTAYPEIVVSGGAGAKIALGYAESLYNPGGARGDKGARGEVKDKEFIGFYDIFIADGGEARTFRPLWWRTYRYLDLQIETGEEALRIEDVRGRFTAYPLVRRGLIKADVPFLQALQDVGWRTVRLCAHETFVDCPYYEQLQYIGDARIQALVVLFSSGDPRLVRSAIRQIDDSRGEDGLTMSRSPSREPQYIPPFSLWWIGMVHDYWRYVDDPQFVREMLPGVRAVLDYFSVRERPSGSLGPLPGWSFVDWTNWERGEPPRDSGGSSASLDLQYLLALRWAAAIEAELGARERAGALQEKAARLASTIRALYWSRKRGMYAEVSSHDHFSQHANALAILAGLVEGEAARELMRRTLEDESLTQCSYYFSHYLHEAMALAGEGGRYLQSLGPWKAMLETGLTTWAERPQGARNASRSDCHGWSAGPSVGLFRIVAGIDSAAPGFRRVLIQPSLGDLRELTGIVPHPRGQIEFSMTRIDGGLSAQVVLPSGVEGEFRWNGETRELSAGVSTLVFAGASEATDR